MSTQNDPSKPAPEVVRVLGTARNRRARRWLERVLLAAVAVGAVWLLIAWRSSAAGKSGIEYLTQPVERGKLAVTVTATGTIEALNSVEVGAEITGRVLTVGAEFNDKVVVGQILATIDTSTYEAKLDESRARLAASQASLRNAQATVKEAKQKALRLKALHEQGLVSDQDLEAAMAAHERASASVASNLAEVTLNGASLKVAASNLEKTIVRSPIDGIVLDRSVEPGQTVTSGLQTPVLFVLAADLSAMRLEVSIDEADVGMVTAGQTATFLVDAYPGREFKSQVLAVKNMPTSSSSVVTYEAWLSVNNDARLLRPGMTATAAIVVNAKDHVLLVPNAALRFTPPSTETASGFNLRNLMRPPRPGGARAAASTSTVTSGAPKEPEHAVWVRNGLGQPEKVTVRVGATDGRRTEVSADNLREGADVIVNAIETTQ